MKIALVAPLDEPVPPTTYGGTELVVSNLAETLVERGHEVHLLASGDSITQAHLVPIIPRSLRRSYPTEDLQLDRQFFKYYAIAEVLKQLQEIKPDIIHNHFGWRLINFSEFIECPMFSTLYGALDTDWEQLTYSHFPGHSFVSISNNQRRAMPGINWIKTVYGGLCLKDYPSANSIIQPNKRDYFVFLGRVAPEKGLYEICKIIKTTPYRLKIAAKVDVAQKEYFESEIMPLIDGKQIVLVDEVTHDEKVDLLKNAKALLLWLNWEEPFSLAAVEAMACGTPVICNVKGSMPEVVENGVTGFLVQDFNDMEQRLDQVKNLDPFACKQHVAVQFTAERMTDEYIALMTELIKKSS